MIYCLRTFLNQQYIFPKNAIMSKFNKKNTAILQKFFDVTKYIIGIHYPKANVK